MTDVEVTAATEADEFGDELRDEALDRDGNTKFCSYFCCN